MIEHRAFKDLGGADHGWLKAKHHFSFADYYDPKRMSFGSLRVWNDDEIAPGTGFPPHAHSDMEIITYVRQGAISHEDNQGNRGRTEAGDVQVMSAGTGIRHAEYNREPVPTTLFQIWIEPTEAGGRPNWGTKPFPKDNRSGHFIVLASGYDVDKEALPIRTKARVLGASLMANESLEYLLSEGRKCYLVPAKGSLDVNGVRINCRDGAAIEKEATLKITALKNSELVLVDVS